MGWTLWLSALANLATAAVYAGVAFALFRRRVKDDARVATRAFGVYWATTGGFLALSSLQLALAAAGSTAPFGLFVLVRYAGLALACGGLAGLLSYFAYLRTGERAWVWKIALAYAAVLAFAWWHVFASGPRAVEVGRWSVDLVYANELEAGFYVPLLVMLLLVPIVAAGWFLSLVRRTDEPRQRYRIVVVSLGIGLQLTGILLVRLSDSDLFQLVTRPLAGVIVAVLVLSAYAGESADALS